MVHKHGGQRLLTSMCFLAMMPFPKPTISKKRKSRTSRGGNDEVMETPEETQPVLNFECKFRPNPKSTTDTVMEDEQVEIEFQKASHLKLSDFSPFASFTRLGFAVSVQIQVD